MKAKGHEKGKAWSVQPSRHSWTGHGTVSRTKVVRERMALHAAYQFQSSTDSPPCACAASSSHPCSSWLGANLAALTLSFRRKRGVRGHRKERIQSAPGSTEETRSCGGVMSTDVSPDREMISRPQLRRALDRTKRVNVVCEASVCVVLRGD